MSAPTHFLPSPLGPAPSLPHVAGSGLLARASAEGAPDVRRSAITLDVIGGIALAAAVGFFLAQVSSLVLTGRGWGIAIGAESLWVVVALVCALFMPSAIRHSIGWRTTVEGLVLDLPELLLATYFMGVLVQSYGLPHGIIKPLAFAISVGLAEELLFRVILLGWLVGRMQTASALVVSSLVFGVVHLHEVSIIGLMSVLPQFAGGMVLGAIYLRTRNPIGPILAHAFWDLPFFLVLGAGISGGGSEAGMPSVMTVVMWTSFAIYGLYLVRWGIPAAGRVEPAVDPLPR